MRIHPMAPEWQVSQWFNTDKSPRLEDFRGKVVVLHAFQMLCPGCVSHGVPQAERLHQLLQGEDAVVIGLHTVFEHHAAMTPVSLDAFLHEYRITHPVGVDIYTDGDTTPVTMRKYTFRGTPSLVIIDRGGHICYHEFGRADDLEVGLVIGRLLKEPAPLPVATTHNDEDVAQDGCSEDKCAIKTDQ